jgi:hypothetical protein
MNIFLTSSSLFVNVVYFNTFNDLYVAFQKLTLECF